MLKFQAQVYRINDVAGWHDRRELKLAPEFQRRRVWSSRGKSFLIDSIIRGMPLPQFFIREIVLPKEKRTIREVVDGQQRLSTILDFIAGKFHILPMHNDELSRLKYEELPEQIQKDFLSFPLSVNILEGTEDQDVLEIFSRLNSYTVPLNEQERLNARYVGAFKKAMLDLSRLHLPYWKRHAVLSSQAIARMKDVELACELVAVMMRGLQNGKKVIGALFKEFDDQFPQADRIFANFAAALQLCEDLFGGDISATAFRRPPLFYSIYAAVYDVGLGFGNIGGDLPQLGSQEAALGTRDLLISLSESLDANQRPDEWAEFYEATRQSTDKLPQRQARHKVLVELIRPAFQR
jgi:hypothetical protein